MTIFHSIKRFLSNFIVLFVFVSFEAAAQPADPCSEAHLDELANNSVCVFEGLSDPAKQQQCARRLLAEQCTAYQNEKAITGPFEQQIRTLEDRISELENDKASRDQEITKLRQEISDQEGINAKQTEENTYLTQKLAELEGLNQGVIPENGQTGADTSANVVAETGKSQVGEGAGGLSVVNSGSGQVAINPGLGQAAINPGSNQTAPNSEPTGAIPDMDQQPGPEINQTENFTLPKEVPLQPIRYGEVKIIDSLTYGNHISATTPDIMSLLSLDFESGLGEITRANGILWLELESGKQPYIGSFASEGIDNQTLQKVMGFVESYSYPATEAPIEIVIYFGTTDGDLAECRGTSKFYFKVKTTRLLRYCTRLRGAVVSASSPLEYPYEARVNEVEGKVTLAFDINARGATENVRIISQSKEPQLNFRRSQNLNNYFDKEAIKYVKGLRFKALERQGAKVMLPDAIITLKFEMEKN